MPFLMESWFLVVNGGVELSVKSERESICVPTPTIYQDLVSTEGTGMD